MGGTGGPGSDRTAAQTGLTGAGLLAGTPDADTKLAALGVENTPQPSSGLLSGADSAIPAPTGITSGSDTLPVAATPATTAAPTFNLSTTTGIAPPVGNAFALAGGIPTLGFPTGVTDETPLGQYSHLPFGTPQTGEPSTGPAITGPAITGPDKARDTGEHAVYGPGIVSGNYGDWGSGSKYGDWFYDFYFSKQHPDGSWWSPNDKTGLTPSHPLGGTGYEFKDPDWFSKNLPKKA